MSDIAQAPDAKPLLKEFRQLHDARVKRALAQQHVTVFLSHLKKDLKSAFVIRDVLQGHLSQNKVKVWLDHEIDRGKQWVVDLEDAVNQADWFVLLYSSAEDDWSWCHEEAGAFLGGRNFDTSKLIVLHPENVTLPSFLGLYQSVPCPSYADDEFDELAADLQARNENILERDRFRAVGKFLKNFFGEEPYPGFGPINPHVLTNQQDRNEITRAIVTAVGRMIVKTKSLRYTMAITVQHPDDIGSVFPDNARVEPGTAGRVLFKTGDEPSTWAAFIDKIDRHETSVLKAWQAIAQACKKTSKVGQLQPVFRIFREVGGMGRFRPFLTRLERSGNNSCAFQLAFIETVESEVANNDMARLVTALTMTYRFQTEVLDNFGSKQKLAFRVNEYMDLHRSPATSDVQLEREALHQIIQLIDSMEDEARNLGVLDPKVADDFGTKQDRDWVASLFMHWNNAKPLIAEAVEKPDQESLAAIFEGFEPVISAFIEVASDRIVELIQARTPPDRSIPDLKPIRDRLAKDKQPAQDVPAV